MDSPLSTEEATLDVDANNLVAYTTTTDTQLLYERGDLDTVVSYDLAGEVTEGVCYAGMASRARYPERSLNGGIKAGFACADRIDVNQ
jgi:hypothetical protein